MEKKEIFSVFKLIKVETINFYDEMSNGGVKDLVSNDHTVFEHVHVKDFNTEEEAENMLKIY